MEPTGVPVLEVDLGPGVRAGVTTADDDFDLSLVLGDDLAAVRRRRVALEGWVGAPLATVRQVHGAGVILLTAAPGALGEDLGEADAVVATTGAVAPTVLVADCVPVLLADAEAGVVAAVHAGRRGLAAGVVEATLERMRGLGARPGRVRAAVGPSICGRCYEVPAAMRDEVAAAVPGTWATTRQGTPALDLPAGVLHRLTEWGVTGVQQVGGCTAEDPRWFSHRAGPERPRGRQAAVVRLLE